MQTPQYFATKLNQVVQSNLSYMQAPQLRSLPEARQCLARLNQTRRELGALKKEIALTKKEIKASYTAARAAQRGKAAGGRAFSGAIHGGAGRFLRAMNTIGNQGAKQRINQTEANALAPYLQIEGSINNILLGSDRLKLEIQNVIMEYRAATSGPASINVSYHPAKSISPPPINQPIAYEQKTSYLNANDYASDDEDDYQEDEYQDDNDESEETYQHGLTYDTRFMVQEDNQPSIYAPSTQPQPQTWLPPSSPPAATQHMTAMQPPFPQTVQVQHTAPSKKLARLGFTPIAQKQRIRFTMIVGLAIYGLIIGVWGLTANPHIKLENGMPALGWVLGLGVLAVMLYIVSNQPADRPLWQKFLVTAWVFATALVFTVTYAGSIGETGNPFTNHLMLPDSIERIKSLIAGEAMVLVLIGIITGLWLLYMNKGTARRTWQ